MRTAIGDYLAETFNLANFLRRDWRRDVPTNVPLWG